MFLSIRTLDGSSTRLDAAVLDRLRSRLKGDLLTASSPDYESARSIWNGMIDRRPALIIRCRGSDDVVQAVRLARDHRLLVAVRGGGHNIAGNAVCDGGLVVDLSPMKEVRVDPAARTAMVEPGCTLADVDRATQEHGLAVPLGINSTTGIAGLTLGGGFGWLSRRDGMTVDSLRSARLVTANGEEVRASETENSELFWGIRGGGGNFGVATSFEFTLRPLGPEVLAGLIVHPYDDAERVLRFYRDFSATLPNETAVWCVLRKAPPLPFLPEEWHGREILVMACFHAGPIAEGERNLEPLRRFGNPIADVIGPAPYAGWQQTFDPLLTPGARNYWKSHDFIALPDELIRLFVDHVGRLPDPQCEVFIGQMGGAIHNLPPDATAYPHRATRYLMNVHGRWNDPSQDAACMAWARELFNAVTPFATGGVYVNFVPEDETERVTNAYGSNYSRLVALKDRYDPDNLFRMNQNIRPSGGAGREAPVPQVPVTG
ncbi:MAG TPA: FAD-binding oxidoreductase [Longimicrobiaceae bacterium]